MGVFYGGGLIEMHSLDCAQQSHAGELASRQNWGGSVGRQSGFIARREKT